MCHIPVLLVRQYVREPYPSTSFETGGPMAGGLRRPVVYRVAIDTDGFWANPQSSSIAAWSQ